MSTIRTVSFLAIKDLKRDKRIAALVIMVIAFSYLNITFFSGFINGLGVTFQESVINTATSHVYISPSESTSPKYITDVDLMRKKIDLHPDVVASAARITVPLTISFRNKDMSAPAYAVMPSEEEAVTTIAQSVDSGTFLSEGSDSEIILGRNIAGQKLEDTLGQETFGTLIEGLGADVGDVVKVTYPNGVTKNYRVRGIVTSFGPNALSQTSFITFREAESVLGLSDKASSILVKLNDRNKADAVKRFIMEQGVRNVEIRTWFEASSFVGAITSTFSVVTFATTLVGIIVVIVTIGIVVFINTARKRRIIGVLKAIGMSSNQIMYIFIFQSILLGTAGMIIGIGLYSAISYSTVVSPIPLPIGDLTIWIPESDKMNVALIILISSFVAGYIPARLASRKKILDTIKTVD